MISICIPAYKYVQLLPEAIVSILDQDEDIEVIVLEDFDLIAPHEAKQELIDKARQLLSSDRRIKWHRNNYSLPIQDNWNKTVSLASGPYIKLMGADDRLLPGSIMKMKEMIKQSPKAALHGHLAYVIDENGKFVRAQRPYNSKVDCIDISGATALKGKLRQKIRFKEPVCNLYQKSSWQAVGGYDTKFRFLADIYFNFKLMSHFHSVLWNYYLVDLRRHQSSDGARLSSELALKELKVFVQTIIDKLGDEATVFDKAAGRGWVLYRLIELFSQRVSRTPIEVTQLLRDNIDLLCSNPVALVYTARLVKNRILYGDIQQVSS